MNKRWLFIIIIVILIILVFPSRKVANDGGTVVYSSTLYKVIKWNRMRTHEENKIGTEVYWFPENMHSLDYYDPPRPDAIAIYNGNKFIVANIGTYQWSKEVDGETLYVNACGLDPLDMEYKDKLEIAQGNHVKTTLPGNVTKIKTYQFYGENAELINNNVFYNEEFQELNVGILNKGDYIIELLVEDGNNDVRYSFKFKIVDGTEYDKQ